jgi:D-3-phosphoglycerate dehydrogenase
VHETTLSDLLAQSDVISLHVPLTEETRHLVGAEFLAACKPGVIVINSSRGKVVDTSALIDALHSGQVAGACLDVFENETPLLYSEAEQLMYDDLFRMPQVVLTPHIAGWTHASKYRIAAQILQEVSALEMIR